MAARPALPLLLLPSWKACYTCFEGAKKSGLLASSKRGDWWSKHEYKGQTTHFLTMSTQKNCRSACSRENKKKKILSSPLKTKQHTLLCNNGMPRPRSPFQAPGNVAFRQNNRPLRQQDASHEGHRIYSHPTLLPPPTCYLKSVHELPTTILYMTPGTRWILREEILSPDLQARFCKLYLADLSVAIV